MAATRVDWGENAFRADILNRRELATAGVSTRALKSIAGGWRHVRDRAGRSPSALLQGRTLAVDVTDRGFAVYPLGRDGRHRARWIPEVDSIDFRPGCAILAIGGRRVIARVHPRLPVLELDGLRPGELAWEDVQTEADGFVTCGSFPQDAVLERNNSTAPDPLPLHGLPRVGMLEHPSDGVVAVVVADDARAAAALAQQWTVERDDEHWPRLLDGLRFDVPHAALQRQLPFSVHNSLFSRSADESGRTIFVHGRRDRGYADTAHLHQSYQMHLPALAAGVGADVRDELLAFAALQQHTGWLRDSPRPLRGSSRYVGRYTNSHMLLAAERYLSWTDDRDVFDTRLASSGDPVRRTLAERVDLAADDLLAHTYRGLSQPCGWADAWNPDVRAQAQATAAAIMGLRSWATASAYLGRPGERFAEAASAMTEAMRSIMLDASTGIVAEHLFDHGVEGGSRDDFWTHTQIWSALAGVTKDARGLDAAAADCLANGMRIAPASAFDREYVAASTDATDSLPLESTATWLMASWPEVTHLYAMARLERSEPDLALAAVEQQLPERLHRQDHSVRPFYYAEKYLYPGVHPWLCTWAGDPSLVEVVLTGFLGVRAAPGRLRITPRLPAAWRGRSLSVRFTWAGESVRLRLDPRLAEDVVVADGQRVPRAIFRPGRVPADVRLGTRTQSIAK